MSRFGSSIYRSGANVFDAKSILGVYNVFAYGATGDGTTDDTVAIQNALTACGNAGGGIVIAPPGTYNLSSSLTSRISIPTNVSFLGTYRGPIAHNGYRDGSPWPTLGGTMLLLPTGGTATYTNAPITVNTNAVLEGFGIYYPNQNQSTAPPTSCPPAIAMRGKNATVRYVELINPYWGIDINTEVNDLAHITERATVEHVTGQPLAFGITCGDQGNGGIPDCVRLTDIHFNPWWSYPQAGTSIPSTLFDWQQSHGIAFIFGDCDELIAKTCFCYGYLVGMKFDAPNRGTYGTFSGCGIDFAQTAVNVVNTQAFGVDFHGGGFVIANGSASWLTLTNGNIAFIGSRFWGTSAGVVSHTGGDLRMTSCYFKVEADIASQGNKITLTDNQFLNASSNVILSGAVKGFVTQNVWPTGTTGNSKVSSTSSGNVVITGNL